MQPSIWTYIIAMAVSAELLLSVQIAQAQVKKNQPPNYYVFNLGAPLGGSTAAAVSINNAGWIAGSSNLPGDTTEHAELWVGAPLNLGTLGGPNSAVGWPNKSDSGEIVGIAETADVNPLQEDWSCALANFPSITHQICLGFVWRDGVMSPLSPFAGGLNSYASAVNDRGQIVGWAENSVRESTCAAPQVLQFEAAVWGPAQGQMTELPPLSGDLDGAATAINDRGQVVGISGICDQAVGRFSARHALLWDDGTPIDLGNFDGGVAWNTPTAINNRTQIAGFANLQNTQAGALNPVAFLWTKSRGMQKLLPLGQDTNSWAWGMNNEGQVVGQSFGTAARAFLYQEGLMTDLNSLIQPNSSLDLLLANDINDRGEIVGFAKDLDTGATVAFLAVPVSGHRDREAGSTRRVVGGFSRFAFAGKK